MSILNTNSAKKSIMQKIKKALKEDQIAKPFPELDQLNTKELFGTIDNDELVELFIANYLAAGGNFIPVADMNEFITKMDELVTTNNWKNVMCAQKDVFSYLMSEKVPYIKEYDIKYEGVDACITDCELAIARTGSFILTSEQNYGRTSSIYYPAHIIILQPHQIIGYLQDALKLMQQKYNKQLPSMINLNTGPSRTADIEKTLVTGIHGPKAIYCFLINN